jgi:hypothetical protein
VLLFASSLLLCYGAFGPDGMYSSWHKAGALLLILSAVASHVAEIERRRGAADGSS